MGWFSKKKEQEPQIPRAPYDLTESDTEYREARMLELIRHEDVFVIHEVKVNGEQVKFIPAPRWEDGWIIMGKVFDTREDAIKYVELIGGKYSTVEA